MSNNLIGTKSILAKLLAGENINVVHRSGISTASFDLKNRTMYLPIWENMDGYMYDMLVGHENGHALYTPPEGWHGAIDDHGRKFKSCLNVIEDARIERLIKRKYPGLAKSFANAYRDLYNRDFFGIKRLSSLGVLNLIDRINIHCKVGSHVIVPFTDEERDIVREVERAETWQQVMDISVRVFEYAKNEDKDQIKSMEDLTQKLLEEFGDDFDATMDDSEREESEDPADPVFSEYEEDEENEDSNSTGKSGKEKESDEDTESTDKSGSEGSSDDDSGEESDEDTEEEAAGDKQGGNNSAHPKDSEKTDDSEEDEEPESVTDRIFRDREHELVVGDTEILSYTLPEAVLENIVVSAEAGLKQFKVAYDLISHHQIPIAETSLKRFNETNGKYINMLVKEFEMRKNAGQYARTTTARTGELDMSKLHLYRFSNDLFKKVSVIPKGKSHGLIIYVDMSGSMNNVFGPTMEQALILATFCKKVGIPFDVYGFSDSNTNVHVMIMDGNLPNNFGLGRKFKKFGNDDYEIMERGFHLRHLIGSSLPRHIYRKAMEMLSVVAYNYRNSRYATHYIDWQRAGLELSGTPFSQTTLASRSMIESFKAKNHLDIVNVIYLTDGDGGNIFSFGKAIKENYAMPSKDRKNTRVIMTDSKTKQRLEFPISLWGTCHDQQSKITQFVAEITGCKHIAYYICGAKECRGQLREYAINAPMTEVRQAEKSYKDYKFFAIPRLGYHRYFYIAMPSTNVEDEDYQITEKMTAKRMAKVFSNAQDSKKKNRMLISQFTQEIAE